MREINKFENFNKKIGGLSPAYLFCFFFEEPTLGNFGYFPIRVQAGHARKRALKTSVFENRVLSSIFKNKRPRKTVKKQLVDNESAN